MKLHDLEIVDKYAKYLSDNIAEIKFLDKNNLYEYLKSHLQIFFSEALDDSGLDVLDRRANSVTNEMQKLAVERLEIEDQLVKVRSDIRHKRRVDMDWLTRANYAFRIKGVQMKTLQDELGKIKLLQRKHISKRNIELSKEKDELEQKLFCYHIKDVYGQERYIELWREVREKHGIPFKNEPKMKQKHLEGKLKSDN